jgi:hypothetical protein
MYKKNQVGDWRSILESPSQILKLFSMLRVPKSIKLYRPEKDW